MPIYRKLCQCQALLRKGLICRHFVGRPAVCFPRFSSTDLLSEKFLLHDAVADKDAFEMSAEDVLILVGPVSAAVIYSSSRCDCLLVPVDMLAWPRHAAHRRLQTASALRRLWSLLELLHFAVHWRFRWLLRFLERLLKGVPGLLVDTIPHPERLECLYTYLQHSLPRSETELLRVSEEFYFLLVGCFRSS